MRRFFTAIALVVPLVAVGLYGFLQPGPAPGEEPEVILKKFDSIPMKIGPWTGFRKELTESTLRGAEAQAYLCRIYRHETTREEVSVLVLYGQPAALGAHTPEVCYSAIGFEPCGAVGKISLPNSEFFPKIELWQGRFQRGRDRETVEVTWGWGADGKWSADDNPRFTYATHQMILKIYAQRATVETVSDTTSSFLSLFFKELNQAVRTRP
jgi:hypothetical protein